METDLYKKTGLSALPEESLNIRPAGERTSTSEEIAGSKMNQAKGALPEGFFDNKDADLGARGIKPVKPDIKCLHFCYLCIFMLSSIQVKC